MHFHLSCCLWVSLRTLPDSLLLPELCWKGVEWVGGEVCRHLIIPSRSLADVSPPPGNTGRLAGREECLGDALSQG